MGTLQSGHYVAFVQAPRSERVRGIKNKQGKTYAVKEDGRIDPIKVNWRKYDDDVNIFKHIFISTFINFNFPICIFQFCMIQKNVIEEGLLSVITRPCRSLRIHVLLQASN